MRVVAIVGMAGAGKSEVSRIFEESGFTRVRFGDLTDEEVKKRGLELTEENERNIRELLRQEHGMAVYAKFNLLRIDSALVHSDVVIDGLYSWEEYTLLKEYYGETLRPFLYLSTVLFSLTEGHKMRRGIPSHSKHKNIHSLISIFRIKICGVATCTAPSFPPRYHPFL